MAVTIAREKCKVQRAAPRLLQILRVLTRGQDLLGRMHDLQVLLERVRQTQASLTPPSVTVWRDLDAIILSIEDDCRRLHARYMHMRPALEAMTCECYRSLIDQTALLTSRALS